MVRYSDALVTILAFVGAHAFTRSWNYDAFSVKSFYTMSIPVREVVALLIVLAAWNFISSRFDLYSSRRFSTWDLDLIEIAKIQGASVVFVLIASLFIYGGDIELVFVAAFWGFGALGMVSTRLAAKYVLKQVRRHGRNLRYMLVAGINARSLRFVRKIDDRPEMGYRVIGFADTDQRMPLGINGKQYPLVTTLDGLPDYLRSHVVDEVIICLPFKSLYEQASNIAYFCEQQGILVRYLSDMFDLKVASSRTYNFEGESLVTLHTASRNDLPALAKSLIDVMVSLILIVLASPVMIAAAAAIKLSSPGPVFFVQERLGINKRIFRMRKFRTMCDGAEALQHTLENRNEVDGPAFKIKDDPRITRVGRFLRRTSIDELPQLFNVVRGEMSLVGPRPLPVRDYQGFSEDWHRRRFSVRPGITCLWQISGRSNISFERWMELDIEYIDCWSLSLDLKILVKTIPAVFRGHGAV